MWPCVTIAHHSEQSYQSTPSLACIYQPTRFRYSLGQQYRPPIRAELPIFPTFTSQYDYVILSGSNTAHQSEQSSQSFQPLPANMIMLFSRAAIPPTNQNRPTNLSTLYQPIRLCIISGSNTAHQSEQSCQSPPGHACIYQPIRFRYCLGKQYRPPIRAELYQSFQPNKNLVVFTWP